MAALEFGDPAARLAAVWLHATGLNAMTYQAILAPLGLRTKLHALDLRGHGRSTLQAKPGSMKSWRRYRDDVIAFLDRESPTRPVILGGHSMGGCVALMVAGARPEKVAGLVLVDPVILSPRYYLLSHLLPRLFSGGHIMARRARKRRDTFGSTAEIKAQYKGRATFKSWRDRFMDDYSLDAFQRVDDNPTESDDQTWQLLCSPKWEAATFSAQRNRPWGALSTVRRKRIPITVLRPQFNSVLTDKVATRMLKKCPHLVMKERVNTSHFLPMEAPYDIRDQLSEFISNLIEGLGADEAGAVKRSLRD